MGDVGDTFNALKDDRRKLREMFGRDCPVCVERLPKASPSILLPQQVCKIHKYRDPRPRLTNADREAAGCEFMEVGQPGGSPAGTKSA